MISYPVAVDGVVSRVLQAGAAGTPVVFVHGTATRADRWAMNLDAQAAAGRRAFAIDLPGHGFAQKGAGVSCSVPAYAEFVGRFIADTFDGEPVVLVGTSLGGHVAARLAVARPQALRALVLVGSMGLAPLGDELRARIGGGAGNQTREAIAMKFTRVVRDQALVTPELIDEEYRVNNSPGAAESLAALGRYIAQRLDDDLAGPALAALDLPKLLVWGDVDPVVPPAIGEQAHALLAGSRLALIAGTAHTPYLEQPEAFNRLLDAFLDGSLGRQAIPGVEVR